VAEKTARGHLERLVNLNVLLKTERDNGALYSPDSLHTRLQSLRDLLEQHNRDELIELKAELQSQIEDWKADYGVDSPSGLRAQTAQTDTAAQTRELKKVTSDWELARYRLSILDEALKNYETYTQD